MSRFLLNGQDLYGNAPQTGDKVSVVDTEGIVGQAGSTTNSQALFDGVAGDLCDVRTDLPNYLTITDEQVLGAWNTLKNDAATQTTEGATFTVNSDSTITINRPTATGVQAICEITKGGFVTETRKSGTYYLSGVPSGASGVTLQYYDQTTGDSWNDYGSGVQITVVKGHTIKIIARVAPSSTVSNVTVSPMIALKPNMPYVPYAMTNRELTERSTIAKTENIGSMAINARKEGNIVCLFFDSMSTLTQNYATDDVILTLPESLWPAYTISFRESLNNKRLLIEQGTGKIKTKESLTSGSSIRGVCTYISK